MSGGPRAELDATLADAERAAVALAREWAQVAVAPQAETWETERRFAREAFASAAEAGLTGLTAPGADGGRALGPVALTRVMEEIAAVDLGVAFSLAVHNNLVGAVARRAAYELRERYLYDLVAGRRLGAFLLTEPGVGSDAAAITTTARREPDGGWVLDGAKAWVSNGAEASVLSVYATTEAGAGHRAVAAFLIDADTPGVERVTPYPLIGAHSLGTAEFLFDNCRVGPDALFVPAGHGFRAAMEGIDLARVLVGAMCCGMLDAGLDVARHYVSGRHAFGQALSGFQAVQFSLADVATDLEASRLLTYRAAQLLAAGEGSAAVAAAHAKKFATRAAERGLAACMQVMGAAGARRHHCLPRHLTGARLTHYLDGATEILDVVIARSLFPAPAPDA
ncbi:MAG: acyl-CoA dehydrogenase family protein [Acidimicrobiales bacterium]